MIRPEIHEWFESGTWRQEWPASPSSSIDRTKFFFAYQSNRQRWMDAFAFLRDTDLNAITTGIYRIDGERLFANVQEYNTIDAQSASYEAHRIYADIQYVISGEERMGLAPLALTSEMVPYDAAKDIVYLAFQPDSFHQATPSNFFVFLPSDAHKPCVKSGFCDFVKKIVLKVRL